MNKPYDVLIVGAGLFGATSAYELCKKGFRCLVLERRKHLGGNCYTELRDGINVHVYGPHIFHTSSRFIWNWIGQFATFNHYRHRVKVTFAGKVYSFPPNLSTFNQIWGVDTPEQARDLLQRVRTTPSKTDDIQSWIISQVGQRIYEIFYEGYTEKQWGKHPSQLPREIVKRIPMRLSYDDSYFNDPYQGIPIGGYTRIFEKLCSGVEVRLDTDYLMERKDFDFCARKIIYTGAIDEFFGYRFGKLGYRNVTLSHERFEVPDFQGIAQMNYTSREVPYTRIIEHKHFEFGIQEGTWISKEYPSNCCDGQAPMYPIRDSENLRVLYQYQELSKEPAYSDCYFGGRLAEYKYYDMHQAVGAALKLSRKVACDLGKIESRDELDITVGSLD